jgi:hypothetical protein
MDQEIFADDDFEATDWVLVSDEVPVDEHARDELIEAFQVRHHPGSARSLSALGGEEDDTTEVDELEPDPEED